MSSPEHLIELAIILGFVLLVVAIGAWRRVSQQKLWQETIRIALEKGQPLPQDWMSASRDRFGRGGCHSAGAELRRGLVLLAIGLGIYLAVPGAGRLWGYLPMCIGVAFLVVAVIQYATSEKDSGPSPSDPQDPSRPV